jgi:hypothetical protein
MSEPITASFVITNEIKAWLESQAQADDRSVSYILRKILEKERNKQQAQQIQEQPTK